MLIPFRHCDRVMSSVNIAGVPTTPKGAFHVTRRMILSIAIVLTTAVSAMAQVVSEGADIAPDNIASLDYARPLVEYICAILFLLLAMGIGFMPSKRVKDA